MENNLFCMMRTHIIVWVNDNEEWDYVYRGTDGKLYIKNAPYQYEELSNFYINKIQDIRKDD